MTIVIAACTNRKRKPVSVMLHVSDLPKAPIANLAKDWAGRLAAAIDTYPAGDIYCGRSFQEAKLAARLLESQLMVVSAGLGLISVNSRVPPYACTVLSDSSDSIASRSEGDYSVAGWWQALSAVSPHAMSIHEIAADAEGLICAALSEAYIELIAADLCALPDQVLTRLRLFTRAPLDRIAPPLQPFVMPYDDRLDGPDSSVRGTRGDFAGRALRHFAEFIAQGTQGASASEHAEAVRAALADWRMAGRFERRRLDDTALLELLRDHWDAEHGSAARLLRRFRDELQIACEQGRFAELARRVREERA